MQMHRRFLIFCLDVSKDIESIPRRRQQRAGESGEGWHCQ